MTQLSQKQYAYTVSLRSNTVPSTRADFQVDIFQVISKTLNPNQSLNLSDLIQGFISSLATDRVLKTQNI